MSTQGFPVPLKPRLLDANGVPANGWQIGTFLAGSSTPLTTYSDALLTSANANPIVTDANGYFTMFVAEAVLIKIVVSDNNAVQQYVLDNLEPMPNTNPSSGSVTAVPTGGIIASGLATAPTGFLVCDGSLVSRATFAALFAAIGTTFGSGDGSTTFGLPDCRQRFPLGVAASGTGSTLGGTGGAIDHTHLDSAHTHTASIPSDSWGANLNNPSVTGRLNTGISSGTGQFAGSYQPSGPQTVTTAANTPAATSSANGPFIALTFLIKT